MLHAHKFRPADADTAEIVAFPAREFGRRPAPEPFSLVVDLGNQPLGRRWFRGAATLAMLCGTAILLAPGFERFRGAPPAAPSSHVQNARLSALALPPLGQEGSVVIPEAPLERGLAVGERDGLKRISGDVSGGLYWSLRDAGLSIEDAADYLKAIATRIDVGEVAPFDRFDAVVDSSEGGLVYAGLRRSQGNDVELMQWKVGGRTGWFGADSADSSSSGLMAPVAGRISSRFGNRVHPIFRFSRFHSGLDFAAPWGSPIVAAADGQVVSAGWKGGYGRQVRVAHGSGMTTSYSHMSGIAAEPGAPVRQGQVIGYVGSSGLSTGPHLHFEVRVGGRAIDPLSARLVSRPALEGRELAAFKTRLKQLTSIPTRPQAVPGVSS